jgi:hypothetical protein
VALDDVPAQGQPDAGARVLVVGVQALKDLEEAVGSR